MECGGDNCSIWHSRTAAGLDVRTGYRWDIGGIRTVDRLWGAAYLGMMMFFSRR